MMYWASSTLLPAASAHASDQARASACANLVFPYPVVELAPRMTMEYSLSSFALRRKSLRV
eukprot:5436958-Heterocapsa_arctica.AAC.1